MPTHLSAASPKRRPMPLSAPARCPADLPRACVQPVSWTPPRTACVLAPQSPAMAQAGPARLTTRPTLQQQARRRCGRRCCRPTLSSTGCRLRAPSRPTRSASPRTPRDPSSSLSSSPPTPHVRRRLLRASKAEAVLMFRRRWGSSRHARRRRTSTQAGGSTLRRRLIPKEPRRCQQRRIGRLRRRLRAALGTRAGMRSALPTWRVAARRLAGAPRPRLPGCPPSCRLGPMTSRRGCIASYPPTRAETRSQMLKHGSRPVRETST
mmetsp:Transcript_79517/g.221110  ORF Transcript_79517/g.221110 Transcript_79517/m.221110 type:complete len:265 (+) Transcript_79517:161-955(+)